MKIFKNNNASSNDLRIDYLEEEATDYEVFIPWKKEFAGSEFFNWLKVKYLEFSSGEAQVDKNIFFFKNESTVAFRVHTEVLNICPTVLWNYWKDEIKDAGYVLKNSETEYRGKKNTLRYYLKPRLKYKLDGFQRFGNITLELIKNSGKPVYIILKCTWYIDQHFRSPDKFSDLFGLLTN